LSLDSTSTKGRRFSSSFSSEVEGGWKSVSFPLRGERTGLSSPDDYLMVLVQRTLVESNGGPSVNGRWRDSFSFFLPDVTISFFSWTLSFLKLHGHEGEPLSPRKESPSSEQGVLLLLAGTLSLSFVRLRRVLSSFFCQRMPLSFSRLSCSGDSVLKGIENKGIFSPPFRWNNFLVLSFFLPESDCAQKSLFSFFPEWKGSAEAIPFPGRHGSFSFSPSLPKRAQRAY